MRSTLSDGPLFLPRQKCADYQCLQMRQAVSLTCNLFQVIRYCSMTVNLN